MPRTAVAITSPTTEFPVAIPYGSIDKPNGNVVENAGSCRIYAKSTSGAETLRVTWHSKGVQVTKDYSIAASGHRVLDPDIDIFGDHNGSDDGAVYLDWPGTGNCQVAALGLKR